MNTKDSNQGYDPYYADINGIKLKRVNEDLCFCEYFSQEGALYLAKSRGLRLPTSEEWKLMLKPGHTWDEVRGGIWIGANHALKAETDLSTFLPAEGYMCDDREDLYYQGSVGNYWSSNVEGKKAYYLDFYDFDVVYPTEIIRSDYGFSVRCVVSD
jgi:uncharacterized protein (TIGR02145 family)